MSEVGVLSAESSSTTALTIKSTSVTLEGTVYSPPSPYEEKDCTLDLGQSGNELSGAFCDRNAGTSL